MPGFLLCCSVNQAHRGAPLAGILLCSSGASVTERSTLGGVLLCSLVCHVFDGPASLLFSCQFWQVGREAMVMAPPPTDDSAVTPFPWLLGFPPLVFPTMISSLTSPQSVSPQPTAPLTLGLLHNSLTPAPSCCAFQETSIPVQGMCACGKECLILIPFRLP